MMEHYTVRQIVYEECKRAKVSRTGLYIMMIITMVYSCDTNQQLTKHIKEHKQCVDQQSKK